MNGQFPIGFKIWDTNGKKPFSKCSLDIYSVQNIKIGEKKVISYDSEELINDWMRPTWQEQSQIIGFLVCAGNDFQHNRFLGIYGKKGNETSSYFKSIYESNLLMSCVYFAVRKCSKATWINDRDQFLHPKTSWILDMEFQADCLAYSLFNTVVKSSDGTNYWIPFKESEVGAHKFQSHFMTNFIAGKANPFNGNGCQCKVNDENTNTAPKKREPLVFSDTAKAVFDAGRELWKYYHSQSDANPNASYYDIREYFQGRDKNGRMNAGSSDAEYTKLNDALKDALDRLAKKIDPKVYEHGFLMQ